MKQINRISIDTIETLVENPNELINLGEGKIIPTMDSGIKLDTYTEKIEKLHYLTYYLGEEETDSFIRNANKFLKENKMYIANAHIRNRKVICQFIGQKLTGNFYKESLQTE